MFLAELYEKHLVDHTLYLVDCAPWFQVLSYYHSLRFDHIHRNWNSTERPFKEPERRIDGFADHARYIQLDTVEIGHKYSYLIQSAQLYIFV